MSTHPFTATLPPPGMPVRSGDPFAEELAALVQDIQRTRDWFNSQLDAQLASLHQLCATTHADESKCSLSMATLFEAPRPVVPEAVVAAEPPAAVQAQPITVAPVPPIASVHQAIVLAPTLTATLDPQLEQATLHELNNALTRAFSEISARGGMLS